MLKHPNQKLRLRQSKPVKNEICHFYCGGNNYKNINCNNKNKVPSVSVVRNMGTNPLNVLNQSIRNFLTSIL